MGKDIDFIRESKLEGVYKRMKQINEYVLTNGMPTEAAEEPQPDGQPPQEIPQEPQGNEQFGQQTPQEAQPQQGEAMAQQPPVDGGVSQDGGMELPSEPDPTLGAEAVGEPTETPEMGESEVEDTPEISMDDDVVDVEDLTNSQETAEYKIDGVDDKLSKLMDMVGKFEKAIEANDAKLEDLKHEVERRNPTDMERINLRSQNSQPFNVNPGEYWSDMKEKNPNYQVIADNEVSPNEEDKVYTITDDDLSNFNTRDIERSFSEYPTDLMGYFK